MLGWRVMGVLMGARFIVCGLVRVGGGVVSLSVGLASAGVIVDKVRMLVMIIVNSVL